MHLQAIPVGACSDRGGTAEAAGPAARAGAAGTNPRARQGGKSDRASGDRQAPSGWQ